MNSNSDQTSSHRTDASLQRRESLVKPTWHNVCPGQVPADTLEKLNKMSNGTHDFGKMTIASNDGQQTIAGGGGNNNVQIGCNSPKLLNQKRQVELFDIFGKVLINIIYKKHCNS